MRRVLRFSGSVLRQRLMYAASLSNARLKKDTGSHTAQSTHLRGVQGLGNAWGSGLGVQGLIGVQGLGFSSAAQVFSGIF